MGDPSADFSILSRLLDFAVDGNDLQRILARQLLLSIEMMTKTIVDGEWTQEINEMSQLHELGFELWTNTKDGNLKAVQDLTPQIEIEFQRLKLLAFYRNEKRRHRRLVPVFDPETPVFGPETQVFDPETEITIGLPYDTNISTFVYGNIKEAQIIMQKWFVVKIKGVLEHGNKLNVFTLHCAIGRILKSIPHDLDGTKADVDNLRSIMLKTITSKLFMYEMPADTYPIDICFQNMREAYNLSLPYKKWVTDGDPIKNIITELSRVRGFPLAVADEKLKLLMCDPYAPDEKEPDFRKWSVW